LLGALARDTETAWLVYSSIEERHNVEIRDSQNRAWPGFAADQCNAQH
jgi:hypothetical protein